MEPNPRYDNKPLLKILECYVLSTIGHLPEHEARALDTLTPTLRQCFKVEGNWQQILSAVLHFPDDIQAQIKDLWTENTEIARKHGVMLTPQKFAEMFADENVWKSES